MAGEAQRSENEQGTRKVQDGEAAAASRQARPLVGFWCLSPGQLRGRTAGVA